MIGLTILGVLYIIWSYFSVKELIKEYKKSYYNAKTYAGIWFLIHVVILCAVIILWLAHDIFTFLTE